jgi:hypothetical protein
MNSYKVKIIREIARERVGQPPAKKIITPKKFKRPKYRTLDISEETHQDDLQES